MVDQTTDPAQELETLRTQLADMEANWKRALADYKNLEKRAAEERLHVIRFANESLLLRVLFILDSLEMLAEHIKDSGLDLIIKEFNKILKDEGLTTIDTVGCDFDPTTMEAIETESATNENDKQKVSKVIQKGYRLFERIIRPAKVKVSN